MSEQRPPEDEVRLWYSGEHPEIQRVSRWLSLLPSDPRCTVCSAPFGGFGGRLLRGRGFGPWEKNPNVCRRCVDFVSRQDVQGAEVELSFVFADVRGSTDLATQMTASEFSTLMNRFYRTATQVLLRHDALVDKFVGDEVIGLFLPAIADDFPTKAMQAADGLLLETGHAETPWVPIGVGVHTGIAFVGAVGESGQITDFTALGEEVNFAARLAAAAGTGEIVVSDATLDRYGLDPDRPVEKRTVGLKGFAEPVPVSVLTVAGSPSLA